MTAPPDLYAAADYGLLPGLPQDELRRLHRHLVRRFHPDLVGQPDAAGRMARINAAYDALRRQAGAAPAAMAPPPRPARRWPVARCALSKDLQRKMEDIALQALDDWLALRHGLPRTPLLRHLGCRTGVCPPVRRPGLLLPRRVSLWAETLVLHHDGAVREGPNILILPGLRAPDGARLAPDGTVRAILRHVSAGSRVLELPPVDVRRYGLAVRTGDSDLPVQLRFAASGADAGEALCSGAAHRFGAVFAGAGRAPRSADPEDGSTR